MTDFFMTQMGRKFYERDVPALVKQLADLNANLRTSVSIGKTFGDQVVDMRVALVQATCRHTRVEPSTIGDGTLRCKQCDAYVEEAPPIDNRTFGERYAEFKGAVPLVEEATVAADFHAVVVNQRDEALTLLKSLLASIHRDGGHHTDNVGLERSVEDAHRKVVELNSQFDEMRNIVRTWSSK